MVLFHHTTHTHQSLSRQSVRKMMVAFHDTTITSPYRLNFKPSCLKTRIFILFSNDAAWCNVQYYIIILPRWLVFVCGLNPPKFSAHRLHGSSLPIFVWFKRGWSWALPQNAINHYNSGLEIALATVTRRCDIVFLQHRDRFHRFPAKYYCLWLTCKTAPLQDIIL